MEINKTNIKEIVKLEDRDYDELNTMANRIIDEDLATLFSEHIYGGKREQINAYLALAKKFPEYKMFCYPETFLKDNDLFVCAENCDFVRRSAVYDMVVNYEEVRDFVEINPNDIATDLVFVEWEGKKKQPDKESIELIRMNYVDFLEYIKELKQEIAKRKKEEESFTQEDIMNYQNVDSEE